MSYKTDTVRIAGVIRESIVDGPGIRFVIFAQGCPHRCKGCHNEETHDFEGGYDCDIDKIVAEAGKNPLLSGVTFSGGEPFSQPEGFYHLAAKIKENYKNMDIIAYTGYTYEELQEIKLDDPYVEKLLELSDYLIDGRFVYEARDLTLPFRGSSNQRHIDLNATRKQGKLVISQ